MQIHHHTNTNDLSSKVGICWIVDFTQHLEDDKHKYVSQVLSTFNSKDTRIPPYPRELKKLLAHRDHKHRVLNHDKHR